MLGKAEPKGEGETNSNCEDTWQKQMGTRSAKVQRALTVQVASDLAVPLLKITPEEGDPTDRQFFIPQCQLPTVLTSCNSLEKPTGPSR